MEQIISSSIRKLASICKPFLEKRNVADIIVIGSSLKGKENPQDIDLCIILKNEDTKVLKNINDVFEKNKLNVHITKTAFSHLFDDAALWNTILHEGYSIRKKSFVSKLLTMRPYFLFEYSLKNLANVEKQSFSHALRGSGGRDSFLKKLQGEKIGRNAFIVPLEKSEEAREFLESWKLWYKVKRIWL